MSLSLAQSIRDFTQLCCLLSVVSVHILSGDIPLTMLSISLSLVNLLLSPFMPVLASNEQQEVAEASDRQWEQEYRRKEEEVERVLG